MTNKSFVGSKKIILLLLFVFMTGGFLFGQSTVTVSGAAAATVNGTYNNVSTTNVDGTPRPYFDLPASTLRLEYRNNPSYGIEWEIWESTDRGGSGTVRYFNTSNSVTPPENGWQADVASLPPPTLSYTLNQAPVLAAIEGTTLSYTEGDAATATTSLITVSDADDTNIESATIQITGNYQNGQDVLSFTNQLGITGTWTAGTGTMSLSGSTTLANYQTVLRSVKFNNTSENPNTSTRIVAFTINDGDANSNTQTRNISVASVNDDPTMVALPTDITVNEDVASNVDLSASIFSDVDAGANSITLTITAGAGALSAATGGGVTISGSGTGTLILTGTASNIDTYLNTTSNIKYTGAQNVNGSDVTTLTLSANDGGATGSGGGGDVSFGTVNVDITAVNDDPTLTGLPTDITVTEETASNVDLSAVTFSDVDAGANTVSLSITAGTGTLSATSGGGVTIGGSGTATLTLSGTVANIDTYLNTASNIQYTGALNASGDNATTLTLTANDGGASGSGGGGNVSLGSVNVDINGINDDPTITGLPTDITVIEDVASNVDLSAVTFADVDAGANNITLTITAGAGILSAASGGGVTITGSGTGTLTLSGTVSNIDTYLNTASNIKYTSASNANGNDITTLTLTANDGGNTGTGGGNDVSLGTVNVDITGVNDPPVVSNVFGDNSSQVIAGSGAQNITDLDDATVTNNDSPDYNSGFLTIAQISGTTNGNFGVDGTTVTSGGDGTITAGETIAVSGTSIGTVHATDDGQGGNNLQIDFNSANSTDARIQSLIRNLTYSAPSGLGARVFTLTLNDKDGTANGGSEETSGNFTITVTPNPPVLGNIDGDHATIPVGGAKGNIDVEGNATVTDSDSPNFNGGNLTITQNSGTANGSFSVTGSGTSGVASGSSTLTADGTISGAEIIFVDGVAIASVSASSHGQSGNNLVLNLGSNATPARTQQVIRALQYAAPSGTGDRTFTLSLQDANVGGATGTANFTITISPPEMDLKQGTTAIADGGSFNYGNKALNSDNDITFTIHNTAAGVLSISTPLTLAGADAAHFSIQQQPGATVAANDSTTFIVRFKPTSTGAKTADIAITNNDANENPYNITLNGSGNSLPTGGNDIITMNEDATYTFSASDFTFNDPDTDAFAGIQLQSLETAGTLTYDGIDAVNLLDYNDVSKLIFTPSLNGSGSPYATFTFKVVDSNGGQSAATYTMTINVNEKPTVTINQSSEQSDPANSSTINFTVIFSESVTGFTTGDVTLSGTAGATTGTVIETVPNNGTTYNVAVTGMNTSGTVIATIAAGVASDAGGAVNKASTSTDNTVTFDASAPSGYSITIDQLVINLENTNSVSFTLTNAEVGATYNYTFSGNGSGNDVSGSGTINNENQQISGIDLSLLADGIITLSVSLTDAIGNAGSPVTDTRTKDTSLPTVNINSTVTEAKNNLPFTVEISFSEGVNGFDIGDIVVGNGNASNFSSISSSLFLFDVTPINTGMVTIDIPGGVVQDSAGNDNTSAIQFSLTSSNNDPILSNIETSVILYTENEAAKQVSGSITVTDIDNANMVSAEVQITDNFQDEEDVLSFTDQNGITGIWDTTTGTLTLNGNSTKENYEAALRSVKYSNTSNNPNTSQRTVSFTINDGDASSNIVIRKVNVVSVNNPPTFLIQNIPLSFQEDNSITISFRAIYNIIEDVDDDVQTLKIEFEGSGKNLTITQPEDTLVIVTPKKDWYGKDTIIVKVSDASSTVNSFLVMTVNPVNDLPEFTDIPSIIILIGDESITLNLFDKVRDVETPSELLHFEITAGNDSLLIDYSSTDGILNISSQDGYKGITEVRIKVTDEDGGEVEKTIKVEVERNITSIEELSGKIPDKYELYQNYPNPFNPSTIIRYSIVEESRVLIKIYNLLGQEVRTLFDGIRKGGYYEEAFNGTGLSSGLYIYSIVGKSIKGEKKYSQTRKMMLIK